jgi:hypothetical protein
MTNEIKALASKYQATVNKVHSWDRRYHDILAADGALGLDDTPASQAAQEKAHDASYDYFDRLPPREQKNFQKQYQKLWGYASID